MHDWAIRWNGGDYGLTQWGDSDCNVYIGHRVLTLRQPAPLVAATLLALVAALVFCPFQLFKYFGKNRNSQPQNKNALPADLNN